jgi:hypothetical protein
VECGVEAGWELRIGAIRGVWSSQTAVEGGVQERGSHAIGGEGVAQRPWSTPDDAVQTKSAEIVGHRTGAVAGQFTTEQGSYQRTEVTVSEARRQMAEVAQCSKQRLDARVAEAQRRDALAGRREGWQLQTVEK